MVAALTQPAPILAGEAGTELAPRFRPRTQGTWELPLDRPLADLASGALTVSVRDRQGNGSKVVRTISVRAAAGEGR